MSNYIQIEMKPSKYGDGGALYAKANIKLDNINAPFRNKVVKIDTGCSISTIPLQKWGVADIVSEEEIRQILGDEAAKELFGI